MQPCLATFAKMALAIPQGRIQRVKGGGLKIYVV